MTEDKISNCIGCKIGTSCWSKEKEGYYHMDLFATAEAGSMYPCRTEGIENYIHENIVDGKSAGIYLPNADVKKFFSDQKLWWEDACDIAREVFSDNDEALGEFFNQGEKGNMMWNQPREIVEKELMRLVKEKGIILDPENYCIIKSN